MQANEILNFYINSTLWINCFIWSRKTKGVRAFIGKGYWLNRNLLCKFTYTVFLSKVVKAFNINSKLLLDFFLFSFSRACISYLHKNSTWTELIKSWIFNQNRIEMMETYSIFSHLCFQRKSLVDIQVYTMERIFFLYMNADACKLMKRN